ncbi:immunoglobulin-like domain-containing protein [Anaerotruncus colihominis]|uniref:immunoglobulin-like domain-containing protein n=1 Tax=Anaerotruncus colihominis TaxID=169435 RepID=UPI002673F8CD|nr:immunoglobulin-like domain-containing protein [Anaerotruncus colihominis]
METKLDYQAAKPAKKRPKWLLAGSGAFVLLAAGAAALLTTHFSLNGSAETVVALGDRYREQGAQASIFGLDLSDRISSDGAVDDSTPGNYTIWYRLDGIPWSTPLARNVQIRDITIPELRLKGSPELTVALNSVFEDPGYDAVDNWDGDITGRVTVHGMVDTSAIGDYELVYEAADSSGNIARATRRVRVDNSSPLTMGIADFTLNGYFSDVILPETAPADESYLEDTVFIGDSITENGLAFGCYPYQSVWSKPALQPDTILDTPITIYGRSPKGRDLELTACEAAARFQPERVVVNVGSNCAFWMKPEEYAQHYEAFIDALRAASPNTLIVVSSIYPVDGRYDDSPNAVYTTNNDKCNRINFALAEVCRKKNVKFLNVAEALKGADGRALPDSLYSSDGIHPREETYQIIRNYILTHPYYGDET